jgi:hypothetical protein
MSSEGMLLITYWLMDSGLLTITVSVITVEIELVCYL